MSTSSVLYAFANTPSEIPSQLTARISNILLSPQISKFDVIYKVYRRQSEKISTLMLSKDPAMLYVLSQTGLYSLGSEFEILLGKMGAWTLRQTIKIYGSTHDVERVSFGKSETLRVRTGIISQGPSSKGIIVEIEKPLNSEIIDEGHQALNEIMGPIQQTLLMNTKKTGVAMHIAHGDSLQTANQSEKSALSYFELLSKF